MTPEAYAPLRGRRVLLVEDEYLTAASVRQMLESAGALVLGPFGWLAEALPFVRDQIGTIELAVLDVNLHGENSYPIADLLAAHHITFVFATGYGAGAVQDGYRHFRRCEKPFSQATLIEALTREWGPGRL